MGVHACACTPQGVLCRTCFLAPAHPWGTHGRFSPSRSPFEPRQCDSPSLQQGTQDLIIAMCVCVCDKFPGWILSGPYRRSHPPTPPTHTHPAATSPPSPQPAPYHLPRSRSRSPTQTSAPADRRRTTPKTTKSRRRTRQSSESNMNSNGSERRRTLEAPELLRSRDPPPGSILAALRRTESSLTHGAATPVHCRGIRPPGSGTSILPIGGGDIPTGPWTAAPEEKTFLVEEI